MPYPQFSDVLSIASFPDTLPHFHFRIEMQPLTFSTYLQNPFFFFFGCEERNNSSSWFSSSFIFFTTECYLETFSYYTYTNYRRDAPLTSTRDPA